MKNLDRKILLYLSVTVLALSALLFGSSQYILAGGFSQLEEMNVRRNVDRVQDALLEVLTNLQSKASDWAAWDDACQFIESGDGAFISSNLQPETMADLHFNLVVFIRPSGRIVFAKSFDALKARERPLPKGFLEFLSEHPWLLRHSSTRSRHSGFIHLPDGPMLLSSLPIVSTRYQGPVRGSLIVASDLDSNLIARLSKTTHYALSSQLLGPLPLSRSFEKAREALLGGKRIFATPLNEDTVSGYFLLRDLTGRPLSIFRVDSPREVFKLGLRTGKYLIFWLLLIAFAFGILAFAIVNKTILGRLSRFSRAVEHIGQTGDHSLRVPEEGDDELFKLAVAVNASLAKLEFSQGELKDALIAASAANQAKGHFLANMSHEIRTPLNGIIGLTELALSTELSDEPREYLELIRTSTDSLRTIINDVLDFSKIEAGKLDFDPIPLSLRACMSTLRTLLPLAHEKGLQFAWYVRSEVPDAFIGDPVRLRQVLVNLVANSIKFTSEGEVIVMVALDSQDEEQAVLHFSVTDSGIGIPKEKQRLIFESFQQADVSMSRRYGGTGLGLTISAELVELMGGKIWIESEEGDGAAFHFTALLRLDRVSPQAVQEAEKQVSLPSLNILLAEDNPVNQKMATRMLEKKGHRVALAGDGKEALVLWEKNPFDLILMDIQMPNLSGYEATAVIREKEKNTSSHVPIIAMTANAMKGDRELYLDGGMDGYIAKPIKSTEFHKEIERVFTLFLEEA